MLIGELSRLTGISTRMLRHYDAIGLVSPTTRSAGGYRDYAEADVRRLFRVESLRTLGLSLQEIRRTLSDEEVEPTALVDRLITRTTERIAREQALLGRLRSVRESGSWAGVLEIVGLLQELDSADPSRRQRSALAGGLPAASLVEALLGEDDPNVAGALQWALDRAPDDVVPALLAALDSPAERVRHQAVAALARLRPAALTGALDHPDQRVRERAALALGTPEAVPELLDMIVRGSADVPAAETLGRLASAPPAGDPAPDIVALVAARLESAEGPARRRLTQALGELPGAHAALAGLLDDPDPAVALTARFLHNRGL
jgi:DNA-binding transcriptional MerR regulator